MHGCMDAWMHGCMDAWRHGGMEAGRHECMHLHSCMHLCLRGMCLCACRVACIGATAAACICARMSLSTDCICIFILYVRLLFLRDPLCTRLRGSRCHASDDSCVHMHIHMCTPSEPRRQNVYRSGRQSVTKEQIHQRLSTGHPCV